MLISVDAKALEWNVAVALSQDPVGLEEIRDGVDIHEVNRERFRLPERLIAKTFLFRLIYGGSAWSYANDADFMPTSESIDFWQKVIEEAYDKYKGLQKWHEQLLIEVPRNGGIYESLSGRFYKYNIYQNRRREWEWPRTQILNYPVQGLAADIVMLARISLYNRLKRGGYRALLINTIHDSIAVDSPEDEWYNISIEMQNVFADLPANFERLFGVKYPLPLRCEIDVDGREFKE